MGLTFLHAVGTGVLCLGLLGVAGCAAQAQARKGSASQAVSDEAPDVVIYGQREDVMRFADDVAARRQLDAASLRAALAQARYQPSVAKYIMPTANGAAKNWKAYRDRFVEPIRLRAGAEFWRANKDTLDRAEAQYGVPPEIVVGILGVETLWGRHMGGYRVIDALATLAFDFPSGRKDRSPFFRDELEALFVLSAAQGIDPSSLKGSYAGAMGMPQFMPSSWNKYAVDFDGDGHIDLHQDPADVIGSVAHYLAEFGWIRGAPTRFAVSPPVDVTERALMLVPDILPTFDAAAFAAHGAALDAAGSGYPGKMALIELQNGGMANTYYAGTENFYAITRYNWSAYYAMAVIELGEAIKAIVSMSP